MQHTMSPRALIREVQKGLDGSSEKQTLENYKQAETQHVIKGFLGSTDQTIDIGTRPPMSSPHPSQSAQQQHQQQQQMKYQQKQQQRQQQQQQQHQSPDETEASSSRLLASRRSDGIASLNTNLAYREKNSISTPNSNGSNGSHASLLSSGGRSKGRSPTEGERYQTPERPLSAVKEYTLNPLLPGDKADMVPTGKRSTTRVPLVQQQKERRPQLRIVKPPSRFSRFENCLICLNVATFVALLITAFALLLFFIFFHAKRQRDLDMLHNL